MKHDLGESYYGEEEDEEVEEEEEDGEPYAKAFELSLEVRFI